MKTVGVSGHQDMPAAATDYIEREVSEFVARRGNIEALSSLAAGADQLFAAIVLSHRGRLSVIIPCDRYEESFSDPVALAAFRKLLIDASNVSVLPFPEPSQAAFLAAGRHVVDRCDELLAIWDGMPSRGMGGTADIVDYARSIDKPVFVIWPDGVRREAPHG